MDELRACRQFSRTDQLMSSLTREIPLTRKPERQGRVTDHDAAASMEMKKQ